MYDFGGSPQLSGLFLHVKDMTITLVLPTSEVDFWKAQNTPKLNRALNGVWGFCYPPHPLSQSFLSGSDSLSSSDTLPGLLAVTTCLPPSAPTTAHSPGPAPSSTHHFPQGPLPGIPSSGKPEASDFRIHRQHHGLVGVRSKKGKGGRLLQLSEAMAGAAKQGADYSGKGTPNSEAKANSLSLCH